MEPVRQAMAEHTAYLARYSSASINKILAQLRRSEINAADELSVLIDKLTPAQRVLLNQGKYTGKGGARIIRLEKIKEQIQALAFAYRNLANAVIREDAKALVASEMEFTKGLIQGITLSAELGAGISATQVYIAAVKNPFEGRVLRDYTRSLELRARNEILKAIRDGFARSETTQDTIKRIIGNPLVYKDGSILRKDGTMPNISGDALIHAKREIAMLVRTSYTHFSAAAYIETFQQLGVEKVIFSATIDGRTSFYCADHDRNVYRIDDPKKPSIPAHRYCRSGWGPFIEGVDIDGLRPFVKSDKSVSQLSRDVKAGKITKAERDKLIGQTSAANSFEDVLNNDKVFAREYLGETRYKLWENGFEFEKFSDPRAANYSIDSLERSNQAIFRRLGLGSYAKKAA